jgi:hypothetical protein
VGAAQGTWAARLIAHLGSRIGCGVGLCGVSQVTSVIFSQYNVLQLRSVRNGSKINARESSLSNDHHRGLTHHIVTMGDCNEEFPFRYAQIISGYFRLGDVAEGLRFTLTNAFTWRPKTEFPVAAARF